MDIYAAAIAATARVHAPKDRTKSGRRRTIRMRQQRTPTTDTAIIDEIMELARKLTKQYGCRFNTDHVVPIVKGGLHHQDNLLIMPRTLEPLKDRAGPEWIVPPGYHVVRVKTPSGYMTRALVPTPAPFPPTSPRRSTS